MTSQRDATNRKLRSWRVNFLNIFGREKNDFLKFCPGAHIANQIKLIQNYEEWWYLNTVEFSFCKAVMPLVKFVIKDVKIPRKCQKLATLPKFSTI